MLPLKREVTMQKEYLTEFGLGVALKKLYPNINLSNNKAVLGSGIKLRPDYHNSQLKIIVEFDGYRHGFIDGKACLPSNFCELGVAKFKRDLKKFEYIKKDIILSLKEKSKKLGDKRLVLPLSLIK
jgi:hypothetical protein